MLDFSQNLRTLARCLSGLCLSFLLLSLATQVPTSVKQAESEALPSSVEQAGPETLADGLDQAGSEALPDWIDWQSGEQVSADGRCYLRLEDRSLSLYSDGRWMAKTPAVWQVQVALFADANADGEDNLILLCWKQGRFGSYHPFWLKAESSDWTQQIFVFYLQDIPAVEIPAEIARVQDQGQELDSQNSAAKAQEQAQKLVSQEAARAQDQARKLPSPIVSKDWPLRPLWMSSDIKVKAQKLFSPAAGQLEITSPEGAVSNWYWQYFGFSSLPQALPPKSE